MPAPASTPAPRARYAAADSEAYTADLARRWRLPATSADSVATFTVAGPRAFRQVRSTKRGSFEDEVVLLAVRYVVV
jgi:hypothetical protein